jgi:hypothetical protein
VRPYVLLLFLVAPFVPGCDNPIWRQLKPHHGTVTILNDAGEEVISGSLDICGQSFQLGGLSSGEARKFSYRVKGDDEFRVSVKFRSGRTLTRRLGYVTSGFDFSSRLIVTRDNMLLDSVRVGDNLQ